MSGSPSPIDPRLIPGVAILPLARHTDERGAFLKICQAGRFAAAGLRHDWAETFCSWSAPRVVRGLHFQTPPHALDKCVCCLSGRILDVIVDLRRGSPTEGCTAEIILDAADPVALHLPQGCAHGFAVLGDAAALVLYLVTEEHAPAADTGIRWSSVPASWPYSDPIVSGRDACLPLLADFVSPFTFTGHPCSAPA